VTLSYSWLLDYLPLPLPLDELRAILTSIGLEVEGVEKSGVEPATLDGLVVGHVLEAEKHPKADRLKLTRVDVGRDEPLRIVCGAPNVAAGQKVIVATVGSTVHPLSKPAFSIGAAVIRGEASEGMLCSADEIGLSPDNSGILVLPADAVPGTSANEALALPPADAAIHIGLTPNRSDAMSHLGVARDVCAYLTHHRGRAYSPRYPEVDANLLVAQDEPGEGRIRIVVDDAALCPMYAGLEMEGINVGPSPEWMQARLRTVGVRPINNVVDATNYVLHEWGQPLHAFNRDAIRGSVVRVGCLPEGTRFRTLDGTDRTLRAEDLMICNADGGMCIAGVFGGEESGVADATTKIFLESAVFAARSVRRTSVHHGLRTDAATRFEKGVNEDGVLPALRRCAALIAETAGGHAAAPIQLVRSAPTPLTRIPVTYDYVSRLSGKTYTPEAVRSILDALGLDVETYDAHGLTVRIPTGRPQMDTPADVVEEILRIDGLDAVETPRRLSYTPATPRQSDRTLRDAAAAVLGGAGFSEILTNSIGNSRHYADVEGLVMLQNSLSSELDCMRPRMAESGLQVVAHNVARRQKDLLLFEHGVVYRQETDGDKRHYRQETRLALWATGSVGGGWAAAAKPADLFVLKGAVVALAQRLGVHGLVERSTEGGGVQWMHGEVEMGGAEPVKPALAAAFGVDVPVAYADLPWDRWVSAAREQKVEYTELPKTPDVQRDLALVLNSDVQYADVLQATRGLHLPLLRDVALFDVYTGEQLGASRKSYALRYTFSGGDRTLTDADTDAAMQTLTNLYRTRFGAEIRA